MFRSIKSRLILLLLFVALPSMTAIYFNADRAKETAIESIRQRAIETTRQLALTQKKIIDETESYLKHLSSVPDIQDPSSPKCGAFLNTILKLNSTYINIGVPSANGELLCNALPLAQQVNVFDREYFQNSLLNKTLAIGNYQFDRASQKTSVNFAYPVIPKPGKEVSGIVVAVVSLDWWSKQLSEYRLPTDSLAFISDALGTVVANHPADTTKHGQSNSRYGLFISGKREYDLETELINGPDGINRIFTHKTLYKKDDDHSVTLSVGIPIDQSLKAANNQFIFTLSIFTGFMLVIALLARYGLNISIIHPLQDLAAATAALEKGQFTKKIGFTGAEELSTLNKHFENMAEARLEAEHSAKKRSEELNSVFEALPDLYFILDHDGVILDYKATPHSDLYAIAEEFSGLKMVEILPDNVAVIFREKLNEHSASKQLVTWEYSLDNDNCTKFFEARACSISGSNEIMIVVRNITDRKHTEEQLKLSASVFTHAREGIMITDASGSIIDVNDTFSLITGYSRKEVLGKNPRIFQSGNQPRNLYDSIWSSLLENKHWHGELWNRRKNGETFAEIVTISAVCDVDGQTQNYVALFTDITTMKEHQQQLEHIAHYDVLTNLPNRTLLADLLQQAMAQSDRHKKSLAIAYLDLDGFKAINDTYGHEAGDKMLIELSQRMKEALREGDTLARIGGDEFIAILVDIERMADCEPVLARLLSAAAEPIAIEIATLHVSASIGVTLYPQDDVDADQLIRHADQAMYEAKQLGKNRYHMFDVHHDTSIIIQRKNLKDIKHALKRHEFVLYYQPKVNMATGVVIGVEALIRWQHPERGLVPPGDFLPITESHPISIDVGDWVIDTALSQIAEWQSAGLDMPISVNMEALQLQEQGFVAKLSAALAKHSEVNPRYLELEILETRALEDFTRVSAIMNACRKIGVGFALDDFGTGYSSLTYLKRLPADLLKIDKSFVRDMLDDPDDEAIIAGIISLAAAFQRQVIAEGVESIAHGTQLLKMGCKLAQGSGIAKPMPASEIPAWTAQWKPDIAWQAKQ